MLAHAYDADTQGKESGRQIHGTSVAKTNPRFRDTLFQRIGQRVIKEDIKNPPPASTLTGTGQHTPHRHIWSIGIFSFNPHNTANILGGQYICHWKKDGLGPGGGYYSLDLNCLPKTHVLKAWSPDYITIRIQGNYENKACWKVFQRLQEETSQGE